MKYLPGLVLALLSAVPADAQVVVRYHRAGKNYTLDLRARFGGDCGYGYGYGYGNGWGTPYVPTTYPGTPYVYSPGWYGSRYPAVPVVRTWGGYVGRPVYGYRIEPWIYDPPIVAPVPAALSDGARAAGTDSLLADGRAAWRAGDPARALAIFKEAVGGNLKHGAAQVHMGLALLAAGDGRNADKAVRSGLELISDRELLEIDLKSCFKDPKAGARYAAALETVGPGRGSFAAGLARLLLGDKARAAALLGPLGEPASVRLAALAK